jgi:hypothetical protein
MSTPAWVARRPTASRHCSRADPRREVSRGYHEGLKSPCMRTPRAPDLQGSRGGRVSEGRLATYAHDCRDVKAVLPDPVEERTEGEKPFIPSLMTHGLRHQGAGAGGDPFRPCRLQVRRSLGVVRAEPRWARINRWALPRPCPRTRRVGSHARASPHPISRLPCRQASPVQEPVSGRGPSGRSAPARR